MTLYLKKENGCLIPADRNGQESLDGLKTNQWYRAVLTKVRYKPFHNKYWAILGEVVDNSDCFNLKPKKYAVKELHNSIKYGIGYVDTIEIISGEERLSYEIPKSTDFDTMDNIEFEVYYNGAMDWLSSQALLNFQD